MKLSLRALIAAVVALGGMQVGQAEEIRLSPQFDPFAQPAAASLFAGPEVSLVSHHAYGDATCGESDYCHSDKPCCGTGHVGKDFYVCQDRDCGWYAQIEMLLLRPYAGGNFLNPANTNPAQLGFKTGFRFIFGRQNSDGLGYRLRFFTYDQSNNFGGGLASIETRYYDAELTKAVDFRRWTLLASSGLRYAEFDGTAGLPATLNDIGFDGVGLTFSGQAARATRINNLKMAASARWSALYGNSKAQTIGGAAAGAAVTPQNDDLVNMLELKIGPQYRRQLRNATLLMGGGLEAQYWSNVTNIASGALPGAADFGFAGFGSSFTLLR